MKFVIRQSAGMGTVFSENAFESQIGKIVPLNLRETHDGPIKGTMGVARLVKADVIDAGHIVDLTFEPVNDVPELDPILEFELPASMSLSFR